MRASRIAVVLTLAAACSGHQPPPTTGPNADDEHETERGAIPEDVVGPPTVAWKELDHRQRMTFMKRVVRPTMKPLFVAFDPKRFRDFDCATCHGRDRDFKMPNPSLFALPARPVETLAADKRAWLTFMTSEVEPEMAKLLGLPELDPVHPNAAGFGCTNCHTLR